MTTALRVALALLALLPWTAAAPQSLESRVERLERLTESRGMVDLVVRLQETQEEMQRLRGHLEEQGHALEEAQRHIREVLSDFDRRLRRLEQGQRAETGPSMAPGLPPPERPSPPRRPPGAPEPPVPPVPEEEGAPVVSPPIGPPPPEAERAPRAQPAGEKAAYEQALDLLQQRRYDEAAVALRGFLDRYPQSRYAPNVWYWLGESHYVQRRLPQALDAFQKVTEQYGSSAKVPDALLKIGMILDEQGNHDKAVETFNDLIDRYPKSSAAYLAQKRMQGTERPRER